MEKIKYKINKVLQSQQSDCAQHVVEMDDEEFCVPERVPGRGKCREVPNGAYEIKITIPERIGNIYTTADRDQGKRRK
jgi:hypothetical protein